MSFLKRLFFLFLLTSYYTQGQNFFENIKYQAESGVYFSTSGKTPFLSRANQYGVVPLESPIFTLRGGIYKEYDSTFNSKNSLKKFGYGYGINAVANLGSVNQVLLPEAYFKIRHKVFELYAGRKREIVGLVDTTLTIGSYIWSGNALPIPKIQISIPNYTPILGKGLVSIKGAYSHGWFDNGAVQNSYLHQKNLYVRLGRPTWKIRWYSGFNHQVQWGGQPATPYIDKTTGQLVTKLPSDFDTYLKVVMGTSLNRGDDGLSIGVPANEGLNRAGNHLGTIDMGMEVSLGRFDLLLYRQSIYEDGSLFYLNNIEDGLLGLSFKKKNRSRGLVGICFEYLNTISQGGHIDNNTTIPQLRGRDNYFNNGIYSDGWNYKGNVIGIPLLMPINSINQKLLVNKNLTDYSPYFVMNRLEAFSLAIEGKGKNLEYHAKMLFAHHLGSYNIPIDTKLFSFIYKIRYHLPKFSIVSHIAFDEGKLFPSSLGGYLGIQRTFF